MWHKEKRKKKRSYIHIDMYTCIFIYIDVYTCIFCKSARRDVATWENVFWYIQLCICIYVYTFVPADATRSGARRDAGERVLTAASGTVSGASFCKTCVLGASSLSVNSDTCASSERFEFFAHRRFWIVRLVVCACVRGSVCVCVCGCVRACVCVCANAHS